MESRNPKQLWIYRDIEIPTITGRKSAPGFQTPWLHHAAGTASNTSKVTSMEQGSSPPAARRCVRVAEHGAAAGNPLETLQLVYKPPRFSAGFPPNPSKLVKLCCIPNMDKLFPVEIPRTIPYTNPVRDWLIGCLIPKEEDVLMCFSLRRLGWNV